MKFEYDKELLDLALTKFQLVPTFARLGKLELTAGYAVINPDRCEVIRTVSPQYKLINNADLVSFIKSNFRIEFLDIFITNGKETTYIDGYFKDIYWTDNAGSTLFVAFHIGNSFSSRFLPFINLSLYNYNEQSLIRTPLKAYDLTRSNFPNDLELNKENIEVLRELTNSNTITSATYKTLKRNMPEWLKGHYDKIIEYYSTRYGLTSYGILLACGYVTAHMWSKKAYETSYTKQIKLFNNIRGGRTA